MHAVYGIYDGVSIRLLEPVKAPANTRAIITFIEEERFDDIPATRIQDVAGCLHYGGPAKTLDDMDDAIRKGVASQWK